MLNGSVFRLAVGRQASGLWRDPRAAGRVSQKRQAGTELFTDGPGLLLHERNLPFDQVGVRSRGNISEAVAEMVQRP